MAAGSADEVVLSELYMKQTVEKRKPSGIVDYVALAMTTWGVGYGPIAPGTWGSMVGVILYLAVGWLDGAEGSYLLQHGFRAEQASSIVWAENGILFVVFCLIGIWAAGRSIPILGDEDPSEAVVDEVIGQLITLCFVPFGIAWPFVLAGFLLFRLFDIWKPYPIDALQILPGGIGVCADDILAGVYAGVCLAVGYAIYTAI